jgi:hypothetical protein
VLSGVAIFIPAIGPIVGVLQKVLDGMNTIVGQGLVGLMSLNDGMALV